MGTRLKRTTVFLTEDQHEGLRRLAFERRTSMAKLLRDAALQTLEDAEDIEAGLRALSTRGRSRGRSTSVGGGSAWVAYEVRLRRAARRALDGLPTREFERIAGIISSLGGSPRPPGARKLADNVLWRVRAGRLR